MREIAAHNLLQCFYLVLQERPNLAHRRRRNFRELRTAAEKQLYQIRVPDTGDKMIQFPRLSPVCHRSGGPRCRIISWLRHPC